MNYFTEFCPICNQELVENNRVFKCLEGNNHFGFDYHESLSKVDFVYLELNDKNIFVHIYSHDPGTWFMDSDGNDLLTVDRHLSYEEIFRYIKSWNFQ